VSVFPPLSHIAQSTNDTNSLPQAQNSRVLYIGVLARKMDAHFTIRSVFVMNARFHMQLARIDSVCSMCFGGFSPVVSPKVGSHRGTDSLIGPDTIHRGGRVGGTDHRKRHH